MLLLWSQRKLKKQRLQGPHMTEYILYRINSGLSLNKQVAATKTINLGKREIWVAIFYPFKYLIFNKSLWNILRNRKV